MVQPADRGNLACREHKPIGHDRLGEGADGGRAARDLGYPADGPVGYGKNSGRDRGEKRPEEQSFGAHRFGGRVGGCVGGCVSGGGVDGVDVAVPGFGQDEQCASETRAAAMMYHAMEELWWVTPSSHVVMNGVAALPRSPESM